MRYRTLLLPLCAAATLLVGCNTQTTETAAPAVSLKPMAKPTEPTVGTAYVSLENGRKEVRLEVIATSTEAITYRSNDGCAFALPTSGFAPVTTFENCEGSSGTQLVRLASDAPWPLTVGKSWRYSFSGRNENGDTWDGERTCTVEDTVRVTAPIGTYDTFKVVCDEPNRTRTYYASPELGVAVMFERRDKRTEKTLKRKLVRIEQERRS